jgi:site-specific DNA-methyltransferase (adenine-specific)
VAVKPFYEKDGITIYHGDFTRLLSEVAAPGSFDCVIADPPYGETSCEWDKRIPYWAAWIGAAIKTSGSMWCFGSLRMFRETAAEFPNWKHAQEIIWEKHNGSNFQDDRFKRVHEIACQFYRAQTKWEAVFKNPLYVPEATKRTLRRKTRPTHTGNIGAAAYESEDGGPKMMRSVIFARSCHGQGMGNETPKPAELVRHLLEYSCPRGGIVLEPFMGSGPTLRAARSLGMRAVGFDVREDQCENAARLLAQGLLEFEEAASA